MENSFLKSLLHSERPNLYTILAFLSATGLESRRVDPLLEGFHHQ